jgi:UDP-N-acetylglucosamine--N-acetylmuramyl-(pentapeptide) pyrophosphoryl-undecaprenol N-acetylglucosamine transferase
MLARIASKICVTFEESAAYFHQGKTVLTGLPVRPDIIAGMEKRAAREVFGLDPDKFTVLVFGGSQGAKRLNEMIFEALPELSSAGLQVLHQSGKKNYDDVVSRQKDVPGYIIRPYIDEMAAAYSAADLVVSRSGASSIAEITARGIPAILIPFPFAQADHQTKNAESISKAGAALALEEAGLSGSALSAIILDLVDDPSRLNAMAEASKKLGRPNAAAEISRIVRDVADTN